MNLTTSRPPEDILADPDVWCVGCRQLRRASGIEDDLCWNCREVSGPPSTRPMTKKELESVIHVSYRLNASWTVKRDDWHGTDDGWKDLIRALNDDHPDADRIYEDAAESFGYDADSHASFGPDVELRLR